jgi:hypothetical protein
MTATLQLLVLVISAFAFAWYVLRRDKREHPGPKESQQSIYFPEQHPDDNPDRRGAAMLQL